MKLRFLKGRLSGRSVDVHPTGFRIGRTDDNDLALDEEGISRRHCRLFYEDGTWFVEDLGSTNGVRVNGTRVTGRFAVKSGDRIGLYNQTLLFSDGSDVVDVDDLAAASVASQETTKVNAAGESPKPSSAGVLPNGMPPSPPASDSGAVHSGAQPASEVQKARGGPPWGRVVVLFILVALLAWFLKMTLQEPADSSESDGTAGTGETQGNLVTTDDNGQLVQQDIPEVVIEMPGQVTEVEVREEEPVPIIQIADVGEERGDGDIEPDAEAAAANRPATVLVESIPAGASVFLGGVNRGKTPLLMKDVPPGQHELVLTKPGYEKLIRKITNPGQLPAEPYGMQLKAGSVRIVSQPEGAAVLHGTQLVGTTPLVLTDLPVGPQEFRIMEFGYEPTVREINVTALRGVEETVVLESVLGGVDFITVPAGCKIYVDGILKGTTVRGDQQRNKSLPLRVGGLKEGEHVARVHHPNGVSKSDMIRIRRNIIGTVSVELWVIDTKLVLNDGSERYGLLFSVNEAGDVIINEMSAGEREARPRQYLKEQITEIAEVGPAEGRQLMEKLGLLHKDEPPNTQLSAHGVRNLDSWDPREGPASGMVYTARRLETMIRETSATAVTKTLGGREIILRGVPVGVDANMDRAEISFGKLISCELDRRTYDRHSPEIQTAREQGLNISVRGKAVAHANVLTLNQCRFISEMEDDD